MGVPDSSFVPGDEHLDPLGQVAIRNRFLGLSLAEDFERVASKLEFLELPRGLALLQPHETSKYDYFPESGIGSIVAPSPEGHSADIGIFARYGMSPIAVALKAAPNAFSTFMRVAENGYRILGTDLTAAIDASEPVETLPGRYAQAHAAQAA